jgi:hypothetical protein
MTVTVKVFDQDGVGYDLCEVEQGSCRVLRVLESHRAPAPENREYSIQYQHACGYRD